MILTTTNSIEHHKIVDYCGIVTGLSLRHPKSSLTFNVQKYYENIRQELEELKEEAFQRLQDNAIKIGAHAVIGIQVDVESVSGSSTVLGVSVTGTAVKVAVANKAYESDDDDLL